MGLVKLKYDDILPYLDHVEPIGDREVKALCPAHDDKKSSFTMKESSDGVAVCNCFAKCSQNAIFNAIYQRMGITPSFENDKPTKKKKIVATYDYINEKGEIINTKVRLEYKDFYWKIKAKNQKEPLPLFNLQSVLENDLIFLVEGEKDVLSLKALGYCATNLKEGLSAENAEKYLSGKRIIVLPDNDKAGAKYARESAEILIGIADSLKMVLLPSVWSEAPEKADISDYIEKGYSVEKIIEKADSLEEYHKEPSKLPDPVRMNHPHFEVWDNVEGYSLNSKNQIIFKKSEDEQIPLCHGSIVITEVIYKNDGLNDEIEFKCEGVTESGEQLSDVTIPAEEFDSLKWISKKWGCSIVPFGNQSTTQRLICGIKLTGRNAKITYKKTHTGYVTRSGKPFAYLHSGGSIGDQGIICELDDVLSQYRLAGCSASEVERKEAFSASLSLLQAHRDSVTYPLLSFVYLAPIMQINKEVNGESGFCLYLRGKTQNGKSTLSALAMCHFGEFTSTTPPTSFESTSNRNEALSFYLKDSVLWIDDFHPKGNKKERDNQNEQFNRIARASGDRASRGRLNSNAELKKSYIPRCLYLVTGEDDPQLSQSGLARIFTLDVKTERKDLSELFRASRNGLLSRAMSDYISYIICNYEEVKKRYKRRYSEVISTARAELGENRLSIQSALLITSLDTWLSYAVTSGLLDDKTVMEVSQKNIHLIGAIAKKNDEEIRLSDPAEKFISTLSTMINNKEVDVRDVKNCSDDNELYNGTYIPRIGWYDDEHYYLDPGKTYSSVKARLESIDDCIGATDRGLYRDMLDKHYIESGDKIGNYTKLKNINGKPKRVIFIKRSVLDLTKK